MILGKYTTVQAIRNILVSEMSYIMAPNRFLIYNQEYQFPNDPNAWVIIKHSLSKVYANNNFTYVNDIGNYVEEQDLNTQDTIIITIMSKNLQALQYKEGIPMALRSVFSQQQQEKYAFKIATLMPIQDLSEVEGGSMYYRFDVTVPVLTCYKLIKGQNYFDEFETYVDVNDGQPDLTATFNPAVL